MGPSVILGDIVALLLACLLFGGLMARFGQSPILGYLLAGMLLGGAGSLDVIVSGHEIEAIAELGVALLLFSIGLEFSFARVRELGTKALIGGVVQVTVTVVAAAVLGNFFGLPFREAVAFGIMISLSSTAVVLRMLMERAEVEMPHGRNSLAVLLTQDMAVVPLALLMAVLGGEGGVSQVAGAITHLLIMMVALVAGLFLITKLSVLMLGTLTLHRNRELTIVFAVVMGLGAAWASSALGISPALGAFLAGMLLGSSAFATQVRADISSIRVVLLTLFFGSAGMVADPMWMLNNWGLVVVVTAMVTLGKALLIWGIFQALGHTVRVASATGVCLAQIGEFAFVLGTIGQSSGAVTSETYSLIVSVAIVSFFLTAFAVPLAPRIGGRIARILGGETLLPNSQESLAKYPEVVVIGFGPAGQIAAMPLVEFGDRVTVIDMNRLSVKEAHRLGFKGIVGDATQDEVLEHAHIERAKAVVISIPHHLSAIAILEHVRAHAPHTPVFVRSRYQKFTDDFEIHGAIVIGDEKEVGRSLAGHLEAWVAAVLRPDSDAVVEESTADRS